MFLRTPSQSPIRIRVIRTNPQTPSPVDRVGKIHFTWSYVIDFMAPQLPPWSKSRTLSLGATCRFQSHIYGCKAGCKHRIKGFAEPFWHETLSNAVAPRLGHTVYSKTKLACNRTRARWRRRHRKLVKSQGWISMAALLNANQCACLFHSNGRTRLDQTYAMEINILKTFELLAKPSIECSSIPAIQSH